MKAVLEIRFADGKGLQGYSAAFGQGVEQTDKGNLVSKPFDAGTLTGTITADVLRFIQPDKTVCWVLHYPDCSYIRGQETA
jgi:hypothetical protein